MKNYLCNECGEIFQDDCPEISCPCCPLCNSSDTEVVEL